MGSDCTVLSIFHPVLLLNFTIILASVVKEAWRENLWPTQGPLYEFLFLV